ncbi:hypothetical protein SNEBB_007564 [Seison nebaliae]|nr:hypothetical protein SNEBB_007564 [Seison nebaliae]
MYPSRGIATDDTPYMQFHSLPRKLHRLPPKSNQQLNIPTNHHINQQKNPQSFPNRFGLKKFVAQPTFIYQHCSQNVKQEDVTIKKVHRSRFHSQNHTPIASQKIERRKIKFLNTKERKRSEKSSREISSDSIIKTTKQSKKKNLSSQNINRKFRSTSRKLRKPTNRVTSLPKCSDHLQSDDSGHYSDKSDTMFPRIKHPLSIFSKPPIDIRSIGRRIIRKNDMDTKKTEEKRTIKPINEKGNHIISDISDLESLDSTSDMLKQEIHNLDSIQRIYNENYDNIKERLEQLKNNISGTDQKLLQLEDDIMKVIMNLDTISTENSILVRIKRKETVKIFQTLQTKLDEKIMELKQSKLYSISIKHNYNEVNFRKFKYPLKSAPTNKSWTCLKQPD